jgi:hypothetical protein
MDETEDKATDDEEAVEPKYGYGLACLWMQLERLTIDEQKKSLNTEIAECRKIIADAKASGKTFAALDVVKEEKKVADAAVKDLRKRAANVVEMITAFKDKIKAAEAAAATAAEAVRIASGKPPKPAPKVKAAGGARGRKKKT